MSPYNLYTFLKQSCSSSKFKGQKSLYYIRGIINFEASPRDAKNSMSLNHRCI